VSVCSPPGKLHKEGVAHEGKTTASMGAPHSCHAVAAELAGSGSQYLKWAFVEAANSVAVNYPRYEHRHVSQLYRRLRERKGHSKAIGAVARHLAESAFYVLQGQQLYRDPAAQAGGATEV
jgi:hypothetical protein